MPLAQSIRSRSPSSVIAPKPMSGLSLGQHPSIAMEQGSVMNRYGAWRDLERDWEALLREGHDVAVRGVFADGDGGTYSPFWCIEEIVDGGEPFEYILTNDGSSHDRHVSGLLWDCGPPPIEVAGFVGRALCEALMAYGAEMNGDEQLLY